MRGSSAFKPGGSRRTILLRLHPRVFGIFRTGQGTPTPGLKPDERDCDSFRDAEASLPLLKQGAPTRLPWESRALTQNVSFSATLKRRSPLLKQGAPTRLPWESRALIQNMSFPRL